MSRERIGLFGGTFDPTHLGHLILASEAEWQLKLSRILWALTPDPPHKIGQSITPLKHRQAMLELAIAENSAFEFSRLDLDRKGPYYTLDTVRILASQQPDADIILLLGGDSLYDLPKWHQPADLVAAVHQIGVMRRPDTLLDLPSLEGLFPGITSKICFVDAPLLEIASREIRRRAETGEPFRYYVPRAVNDYIILHRLYQKP